METNLQRKVVLVTGGGQGLGEAICAELGDAGASVLVADRSERAKRRMAERPGIGADALATDLRARDEKDAVRMQPAEDATEIDTTDLEVEQVVEQIEQMVRARTAA